MNFAVAVAVAVAVALFAASRVAIVSFHVEHDPVTPLAFYKDAAHLFVGGLIGGWLANRKLKWLLWAAVGLSVLETLCFLAGLFE